MKPKTTNKKSRKAMLIRLHRMINFLVFEARELGGSQNAKKTYPCVFNAARNILAKIDRQKRAKR